VSRAPFLEFHQLNQHSLLKFLKSIEKSLTLKLKITFLKATGISPNSKLSTLGTRVLLTVQVLASMYSTFT
jgi:hypothetical protein